MPPWLSYSPIGCVSTGQLKVTRNKKRYCRLRHPNGPDLIAVPFGFHTYYLVWDPSGQRPLIRNVVCSDLAHGSYQKGLLCCRALLTCSTWFSFLSLWTQEMKRISADIVHFCPSSRGCTGPKCISAAQRRTSVSRRQAGKVNFALIFCLISKFPSFPIESKHTWDYFYPELFLLSLSYVASHMAVKRAPPPHRHARDRRQQRLEGRFLPLQHDRAGGKRAAGNYSTASLDQLLLAALLPSPPGAVRLFLANTAACTSPVAGDTSSQTCSHPDGAAPRDPIHAVLLLHHRAVSPQEDNRVLAQAEGA